MAEGCGDVLGKWYGEDGRRRRRDEKMKMNAASWESQREGVAGENSEIERERVKGVETKACMELEMREK